MKLLKKRITNSNNTLAILLASKEEIELLQAMSRMAYMNHPKTASTMTTHSRLHTIYKTLTKATTKWSELPIVDKV